MELQCFFSKKTIKLIPEVIKNQLLKINPGKFKNYKMEDILSKKKTMIRSLFGLDLVELTMYENSGIPFILIMFIKYFINKPENLKIEGIFRVSGSQSENEFIEEIIINKSYYEFFQLTNPNAVAGIFKRFFSELPEPLFPFEIYELMISFKGIFLKFKERKQKLNFYLQNLF